MRTPSLKSRENLFDCVNAIWEDVHNGKTSYEDLSVRLYTSIYRVGTFRKDMIKRIIENPQRPTMDDVINLRKLINYSVNGVGLEDEFKRCSKCGEIKEYSKFNKSSSHKDGLQSYCKLCDREHGKLKNGSTGIYRNISEELQKFTDKQLISELKQRGYNGELKKLVKIEI